jgi:serine/threonine-protein kinase
MLRDVDRPHNLGGKYELVAPVGVGGMATVWRGLAHGEDGFTRSVAIKRLLPWAAADASAVAMFIEEARIVSELSHPNIVQVLDFCRGEDEQSIIVMEWVEGIDLARYLESFLAHHELVPWPYATAIAIEVLRALHAGHSHTSATGEPAPVLHRDVTPANVLVGVNGVSKLADFGMARAMDRGSVTQPGALKGKLAYMAPEILGGAGATAATDIYSLGVVLWEAFAGRRLRLSRDPVELFAAAATPAPPISEMRDDLPPTLAEAVDRSVALEPEARFPDARQMAVALRRVLRTCDVETDEQAIGATVVRARERQRSDRRIDAPEESGEWPPAGGRPPAGF